MTELRSIVEGRRSSHLKGYIYLARIVLSVNESDTLTEAYALAVNFDDSKPEYEYISQLRSRRRPDAARLWTYGSLSDIVETELLPEQEKRVLDELRAKNTNIFDYHPDIAQAKIVRMQFFARARELERIAREICPDYKLEKIGKYPRDKYKRELERAPAARSFQVLRAA